MKKVFALETPWFGDIIFGSSEELSEWLKSQINAEEFQLGDDLEFKISPKEITQEEFDNLPDAY